jgi:hypothetical protein
MRWMTWQATGLADIAPQVIGCHLTRNSGLTMRWMTWRATSARPYCEVVAQHVARDADGILAGAGAGHGGGDGVLGARPGRCFLSLLRMRRAKIISSVRG